MGVWGVKTPPGRCLYFTAFVSPPLSCAYSGAVSVIESMTPRCTSASLHDAAVFPAVARSCLDVALGRIQAIEPRLTSMPPIDQHF